MLLTYQGVPLGELSGIERRGATAWPWEAKLGLKAPLPKAVEARVREVWMLCEEGAFSCLDDAEERVAMLGLEVVTSNGDVLRVESMALSQDDRAFLRTIPSLMV